MEGWLWAITAILCSALVTVFKDSRKKWFVRPKAMNWPPGPRKLPIIGNLHQLRNGGELAHVTLAKLAQKHGGIMTIWFGSWGPTIIVSDLELAWEFLVSKSSDFSSRKLPYISRIINADLQTLSTSDLGPYWYKLRNGLHSTTLNPKSILEQTPLQEKDVAKLVFSLQNEASSNDRVVQPLFHLRRNTINLIGRFCFGPQFKDDIFVDYIDTTIGEVLRLSGHSGLSQVFPFFRYVPVLNRPFIELQKLSYTIEGLFRPYITSPTTPKDGYLQFLISQGLSEKIIISNLFEMFMLAVDSVSGTTTWALAYLICDQKLQQRLYEEVSREIGSEKVTIQKTKGLQYLNAVVKETLRMKPIAPLAVPHRAVRDSTLMGNKIVAGTTIVVNLYAVLRDPNVWVEPHRFMPERFLGCLGVSNEMERSFLPFGAGRRICPAMELAKQQIGFILASLVQKFQWSSVVDNQLPDLTEDLTFILAMKMPLAARIALRSS
ncbi:hypothetical protein ACHQM5_028735 [Ranunculus cassubicifolius]